MKLIGLATVLLVIFGLVALTRVGGAAPAPAGCPNAQPYKADSGPLRLQDSCRRQP